METQVLDYQNHHSANEYNPNIDTSRPFRSVKEAVAIFGEKFLVGEVYGAKPVFNFPKQETPRFYTPSPSPQESHSETSVFDGNLDLKMMESLKKLQAELEETKMELRLLKEKESETEVALASLNAELHKNMSKLARAEAEAASNAIANHNHNHFGNGLKGRWDNSSTTLAQVLSAAEEHNIKTELKKKEKKLVKKKPIIPLMGDLFRKKKGSPTTLHNPLFSSHLSLN